MEQDHAQGQDGEQGQDNRQYSGALAQGGEVNWPKGQQPGFRHGFPKGLENAGKQIPNPQKWAGFELFEGDVFVIGGLIREEEDAPEREANPQDKIRRKVDDYATDFRFFDNEPEQTQTRKFEEVEVFGGE